MEEFDNPFFYGEIVEGGHAASAYREEQSGTWAEEYVYLFRKLVDWCNFDSGSSAGSASRGKSYIKFSKFIH